MKCNITRQCGHYMKKAATEHRAGSHKLLQGTRADSTEEVGLTLGLDGQGVFWARDTQQGGREKPARATSLSLCFNSLGLRQKVGMPEPRCSHRDRTTGHTCLLCSGSPNPHGHTTQSALCFGTRKPVAAVAGHWHHCDLLTPAARRSNDTMSRGATLTHGMPSREPEPAHSPALPTSKHPHATS